MSVPTSSDSERAVLTLLLKSLNQMADRGAGSLAARLFAALPDSARSEILQALEAQGFTSSQVSQILGIGVRRIRAIRSLAKLPIEVRDALRVNELGEAQLRYLMNHPRHVPLEELVRLVGIYQPPRQVLSGWMTALYKESRLNPEQVLVSLLKGKRIPRERLAGKSRSVAN